MLRGMCIQLVAQTVDRVHGPMLHMCRQFPTTIRGRVIQAHCSYVFIQHLCVSYRQEQQVALSGDGGEDVKFSLQGLIEVLEAVKVMESSPDGRSFLQYQLLHTASSLVDLCLPDVDRKSAGLAKIIHIMKRWHHWCKGRLEPHISRVGEQTWYVHFKYRQKQEVLQGKDVEEDDNDDDDDDL